MRSPAGFGRRGLPACATIRHDPRGNRLHGGPLIPDMAEKITDYQDIVDDRADRLVRDQRRRIAAAVTVTDPDLAADLIDEAIRQGERLKVGLKIGG